MASNDKWAPQTGMQDCCIHKKNPYSGKQGLYSQRHLIVKYPEVSKPDTRIILNAGILLIGPLGTNFAEIKIVIHNSWFTKCWLQNSSHFVSASTC